MPMSSRPREGLGPQRGSLRKSPRQKITARGLALVYLLFGLVWIFVSGYLGPQLEPDEIGLRNYEMIKGSVFVLLSAGLVFVLARMADRARIRQLRRAGRFQTLVDNVPDLVFWLARRDGRELLYVSPAVETMFGVSRTEIYANPKSLWERLEPEDGGSAPSLPGSLIADGEYRIVKDDGRAEWITAQAYAVSDPDEGGRLVAGVLQNVTERKEALQAARERQGLLERAQEIGELGYWTLYRNTGEIDWSDQVYCIFGRRRGEFDPTYENFLACVHPEDRATQEAADRALLDGRAPLDLRNRIVRPDGEVRYVHERAELTDVGEDRVLGTVQDVTSHVRLEEELRESRDLLRSWAAKEVTVRERERLEISREIHDELGQLLTAIRLRLEREPDEPAEGHRRESIEIVDRAIQSVRDLAGRLRPPMLEQLGLIDALEEHVRWFGENTEVTVEMISDVEDVALDADSSVHLYRIVQEALTNVARHADADRASVEVRREEEALRITIRDDGRGLSGNAETGHGIVGMRERAMALGGTLNLDRSRDGGTRVTVRIPTRETART